MSVRNVAVYLTNIAKLQNKLSTIGNRYNEKFKGTIIEKWAKYWKQLYTDYKEVAVDLRKDCKERPAKAAVILSGFALLWMFAKTNPDEVSFRDAVLKSTNDLLLVNPTSQRKSTVEHLRLLEKCYNANVLRRQSFLFFSIIWIDNNSIYCNKFECNCSYLEVSYVQILKRIIDIGFVNKWWLLEKHVEDYDVNF